MRVILDYGESLEIDFEGGIFGTVTVTNGDQALTIETDRSDDEGKVGVIWTKSGIS